MNRIAHAKLGEIDKPVEFALNVGVGPEWLAAAFRAREVLLRAERAELVQAILTEQARLRKLAVDAARAGAQAELAGRGTSDATPAGLDQAAEARRRSRPGRVPVQGPPKPLEGTSSSGRKGSQTKLSSTASAAKPKVSPLRRVVERLFSLLGRGTRS